VKRRGPELSVPALLLAPIHWSARKEDSANFALEMFSESRLPANWVPGSTLGEGHRTLG
jgi:hypothetical protein